jgi:hypothetical protein
MRLKNIDVGACMALFAGLFVLASAGLTATPALALTNPERHYEMVSPPYKGGYGASAITAAAPNGESVVFNSRGAFAGAPASPGNGPAAPYVARRGPSGWSTTPLVVPTALSPEGATGFDISPTLESYLAVGTPGANFGEANLTGSEQQFLLHPVDSPDLPTDWPVIGALKAPNDHVLTLNYYGASDDFSHIVFGADGPDGEFLLPGGEHSAMLYELVSRDGESSLRFVGVKSGAGGEPELIDPYCPVLLGFEGGEAGGRASQFNAVSANGDAIFFTANANQGYTENADCDGTTHATFAANPAILFVRLGGEKTLQVSAPLPVDCVSGPCLSASQQRAEFEGANETGTIAFFATTQPLVTGDTDGAKDLYMARIGCEGGGQGCAVSEREVTSLVQVSHDPHLGQSAEVQNVVAVSPDGSRIYFAARGVLDEGANAEGLSPLAGADNLYVYDSTSGEAPVFIADLCSGPEASGEAKDSRCPDNLSETISGGQATENDTQLWAGTAEAQTAGGDGRFLLFSSYGRLVVGDTDTAKDVYRYDAVTGTLDRVSGGEGGDDANGNNSAFDAEISESRTDGARYQLDGMGTRLISEDGTRVVFKSAEPLSPAAINGLANIYEWHKEPDWSEGKVSLVSSGSSTESIGGNPDETATGVTISPSGSDIFFQTTASLVAQDVDDAPDIYDARLGGGFPASAASPQPCSGDACQGPLTNPVPLLVPGSVSQAPGQDFPAPAAAAATPPKKAALTCARGAKSSHGKCVKVKSKRKKRAKRIPHDRRSK